MEQISNDKTQLRRKNLSLNFQPIRREASKLLVVKDKTYNDNTGFDQMPQKRMMESSIKEKHKKQIQKPKFQH